MVTNLLFFTGDRRQIITLARILFNCYLKIDRGETWGNRRERPVSATPASLCHLHTLARSLLLAFSARVGKRLKLRASVCLVLRRQTNRARIDCDEALSYGRALPKTKLSSRPASLDPITADGLQYIVASDPTRLFSYLQFSRHAVY